MNFCRFCVVIILFPFISNGQNTGVHKSDPAAVKLYSQAMQLVINIDNPDSARKALDLLNQATAIDSDYFYGHYNKLMFYYKLGQFDEALVTVQKLLRMRPHAHDLYLTAAALFESKGDTSRSRQFFTHSLQISQAVLDTMPAGNHNYVLYSIDRALSLIMLGEEQQAHTLLKALYDTLPDDPDLENVNKRYIHSLLSLSKQDLLKIGKGDTDRGY